MIETIRKRLLENEMVIDVHTHVGSSFKALMAGEFPYAMSFEDLVIRMKTLGVDVSCVFPFPHSAFYKVSKEPVTEVSTTSEWCDFPYEVENERLCQELFDVFPEYVDKALLFLMFDPSRKTTEQADHIKKLMRKYPVFGLKTCTHQIKAFISDLNGDGKIFADLAAERGLPLLCHASYYSGDPWANVYDILDFATKRPDLRICVAHSARFAKDALDQADAMENVFVDLSAFDIHCELARTNNPAVPDQRERFPTDYENPQKAFADLVEAYPDTLIWGSDTPFNYCFVNMVYVNGKSGDKALKSTFDGEQKLLFSLSSERIKRIAHENTMKFLFGG